MKQVFPQPEGHTIKILEGVFNRNAFPLSISLCIPRLFSVGNVIFGASTRVTSGDEGKPTKGSLILAIFKSLPTSITF